MRLPRLVVFDLDGLLWSPEIYELWGSGGSPFRLDPKSLDCTDRSGTHVRLIGHSRAALLQLSRLRPDVLVGISSKTDEPSWARECLATMEVEKGVKVADVLEPKAVVLSKRSKTEHFQHMRETLGIPFSEMIFFDNEYGNIRAVSPLGVHCFYCPEGLTKKHWEKALADYAAKMGPPRDL
ncbi:magnesium-dependent phosphatase-1 [Hyaloraphidium curvatum]|nr:magnesium-dependent phosphatase-1 [Hyaloraphidium curvatum]